MTADPARTTGPAPGHSLDEARQRNRQVLDGPQRAPNQKSELTRWLSEEIRAGGTKRSDLEHLLPVKALRTIKTLEPPRVDGEPDVEEFRCVIIAVVIETALHNDTKGLLDRETLSTHADKERELGRLFGQLLDMNRKEGRY